MGYSFVSFFEKSAPIDIPVVWLEKRSPLNFDVRTALYQLIGVDLTQIHGIGPFAENLGNGAIAK